MIEKSSFAILDSLILLHLNGITLFCLFILSSFHVQLTLLGFMHLRFDGVELYAQLLGESFAKTLHTRRDTLFGIAKGRMERGGHFLLNDPFDDVKPMKITIMTMLLFFGNPHVLKK